MIKLVEEDVLSQLLSEGVVFHWSNNMLSCSSPPNTSLEQFMVQSGIDDHTLSAALANSVTKELKTKTVLASGFLTPGQERLVRSSQIMMGIPTHIKPTAILIEGMLDEARLEKAIDKTIIRHPALRAQLRLRSDGTLVQLITSPSTVKFSATDLRDHSNNKIALKKYIKQMSSIPVDIMNDFFEVKLFRLEEKCSCLVFSINHTISDVWSLGLFYETLSQTYTGSLEVEQDVYESAVTYLNLIKGIQDRRQGDEQRHGLNYWTKELSFPLQPLKWKGIGADQKVLGFKISDHLFSIGSTDLAKCEDCAKNTGITLSQQLLTAWALTLRSNSYNNDIRIGVMGACRTSIELEVEMGFFSNPIVLRIDFSNISTVEDVSKYVRTKLNYGLTNQEIPIQDVVTELEKNPNFDLPRLYQAIFAFNNVPTTELNLDGLICNEIDPTATDNRSEISTIDIRLSLTPKTDVIDGLLTYKSQLFSRQRIEKITRDFQFWLGVIRKNKEYLWEDSL